jgi:hypothetical protein
MAIGSASTSPDEHEDVELGRIEGLQAAVKVLRTGQTEPDGVRRGVEPHGLTYSFSAVVSTFV